MEENVDVKSLTARFRQAGMMAGGGAGLSKLPPPILERGVHSPVDSGVNGGVRSRLSAGLNKPATGLISPSNVSKFGSSPRGVFPRPPPSYRPNPQEPVRPPFTEPDKPGPFRSPGEKLVRPMPKPQISPGGRGAQTFQTPPLPKQRSMSGEVPPLLRPLPAMGPRPNKPKRPPFVNLEPFWRNLGTPKPSALLSGRASEDGNSPTASKASGVSRIPLPPNKPRMSVQMPEQARPVSNQDLDDDQDTYDDIDALLLPPPPSPPPTQSQEGFSPSRTAGRSSLPLVFNKPSSMVEALSDHNLEDDQDTYDDIGELLPPPPPPPTQSQDSWTDQHSSQADEFDDSDESEIYEEVDQDNIPVPTDISKQTKKDIKRQKEQEKKEQREREKRQSANRKTFKLTGKETPVHIARVREDWHGGKNDLSVYQGDSVEIIRIKNNPEGKWLARTMDGICGYISTRCVDMDYEEVKRRFGSLGSPRPVSNLVYDDVESNMEGHGFDDDKFPPPPPEIGPDPRTLKKMEKEEKEFRKKFKFDGPITVLQFMTVDPNANLKKGGGKDLTVVRGETLDVIQFTNEKKALCRNPQGKYGYVPMAYLLQEDGGIYDDIDLSRDVYDNDSNMR
ncbi:FYN-binding protein 1 isoform X2 [Clupea harengus]|uniref:FYN-binding protein 1 isoform X2 n=1 Tax=Clupea harengus TaxID=7950 RepID=A0A8M1K893_CLUHA|nr:FYN-binding protein 1 isoform X2 [Clupea harengus]